MNFITLVIKQALKVNSYIIIVYCECVCESASCSSVEELKGGLSPQQEAASLFPY